MGRPHLSADVLSAFADGELAPHEEAQAREHVFECAACAASYKSIRAFDLQLRKAPSLGCDAALPLISARFDGELDDAETAVANAHLASCEDCRRTTAGIPAVAT